MKPIVTDTGDRRWQTVYERDTRAGGQFAFAALITGICCYPSCHSCRARRGNVRFFADATAAVAAGFRPCKRYQSGKDDLQQQRIDEVAQIYRLLEQGAPLTFEALTRELAVSPFHFHRLFKSITDMTLKARQQAWRVRRLREVLEQGNTVTRAALATGSPDSSSYYRQAGAALDTTACQFHRGGAATVVTQTTGDCALGRCLVVQGRCGVCVVLPGNNDAALLDDLYQHFPNTELCQGIPKFCRQMARIFAHLDDSRRPVSLPLDLQSAAFQLQVWQAPQQVPAGKTRNYRQVVEHTDLPRATGAVADTCAANPLMVIVPRHRVVRGSGALPGYHWGTARKTQLLAHETQHEEE